MKKTNLVVSILGVLGLAVIGLSNGLFLKSHPYVSSQTVTTTAGGEERVDREYAEVRSGLKLDWSGGVTLSYTTVDMAQSDGIGLPSVRQRSWRLGL
ncbi:hypothetical protein ACEOSU_20670 [Pseudomonas aeruginosa]